MMNFAMQWKVYFLEVLWQTNKEKGSVRLTLPLREQRPVWLVFNVLFFKENTWCENLPPARPAANDEPIIMNFKGKIY